MAPEVLDKKKTGSGYNKMADIFSLAVTILWTQCGNVEYDRMQGQSVTN